MERLRERKPERDTHREIKIAVRVRNTEKLRFVRMNINKRDVIVKTIKDTKTCN